MSYDENKISDLIDGGLKQQEETMKIDYALYRKVSDTVPQIRFETLGAAKEEYLKSKDYSMIVTEVSEIRHGKKVITQERVIKSPQIWLPSDRFIPEFDDDYLCHLVQKTECGSYIKYQDVIAFEKLEWKVCIGTRVTHWMIVENPVSKLKLL